MPGRPRRPCSRATPLAIIKSLSQSAAQSMSRCGRQARVKRVDVIALRRGRPAQPGPHSLRTQLSPPARSNSPPRLTGNSWRGLQTCLASSPSETTLTSSASPRWKRQPRSAKPLQINSPRRWRGRHGIHRTAAISRRSVADRGSPGPRRWRKAPIGGAIRLKRRSRAATARLARAQDCIMLS